MVELNSTLLWQIINFIILLWLLKRYLYGPLTEMMDKRATKINNDLDEAARQKEKAQELKQERREDLKEARQKAQEIIEDAEERAKKRAKDIIEEAKEEARKIEKNKLAEIERARREALSELRDEVSSISLLAASRFMKEELDQEKHEELIKSYIDSLDEEKLGEIV